MTSKPVLVNRDLRSHRRTVLAGRRQRKGLRVRLGAEGMSSDIWTIYPRTFRQRLYHEVELTALAENFHCAQSWCHGGQ